MTRSLLNALSVVAAAVGMFVLTNYLFLQRFGLGHTVSKVAGLMIARVAGPWFAALVVSFAMVDVRRRSPARAIGAALLVPAVYLPVTVLALLIAALVAAPLIGFVVREFYDVLDLRDWAHGALAATFTATTPVAVMYGAPANWSELPVGTKLRWLALLGLGVVLVSQVMARLPV